MEKKIRFPLEMDNGVEVRDMEGLKEHFSLAKVLEYFENGKLVVWLRDHYENNIADAVEALGKDEQDLVKKLSEIFDVPYDEDTEEELEKAAERAERLKRLKEYTDDEQFWNKVDNVAFEQDELYDLLDEEEETIYLCGERFSIPLSKSGVQYIGINNPTVVIASKVLVDWDEKGISLEGVVFDEKYQKIVDESSQESVDGENILINENICRPKCITSELIGSVEQKTADKCVHEYKYNKKRKLKLLKNRNIEKKIKEEYFTYYLDDDDDLDEDDFESIINSGAFNQEELNELLGRYEDRIYLYGEQFSIPLDMINQEYINHIKESYRRCCGESWNERDICIDFRGINNPTVVIKSSLYDFLENKEVCFENIRFADDNYRKANYLKEVRKYYESYRSLFGSSFEGDKGIVKKLIRKLSIHELFKITAFDQADLSRLLQDGADTIYLAGEGPFHVFKYKNIRKYIGISLFGEDETTVIIDDEEYEEFEDDEEYEELEKAGSIFINVDII